MQQVTSEMPAAVSVILPADFQRPAQGHELPGLDREQISNRVSPAQSSQNTQCFICSRIYFGQRLHRCPRCNSDSVLHFPTADLDHFARDPVTRPSASDRRIELEE